MTDRGNTQAAPPGSLNFPARKAVTMAVLNAMTDPIDQALHFGERRSIEYDRPIRPNEVTSCD